MLTVHDCTFDVRWSGWGAYTPYAERVAQGVMLTILTMAPDKVRRLAASQQKQADMSLGARIAIDRMLAKKNKATPLKGTIAVEAVTCPKA